MIMLKYGRFERHWWVISICIAIIVTLAITEIRYWWFDFQWYGYASIFIGALIVIYKAEKLVR